VRWPTCPALLFSFLLLLCPTPSVAVEVPLSNGRLALAIEVLGAEFAGADSVRGVPGAAWQGEGRVVLELRVSYRHPSGSAPRLLSLEVAERDGLVPSEVVSSETTRATYRVVVELDALVRSVLDLHLTGRVTAETDAGPESADFEALVELHRRRLILPPETAEGDPLPLLPDHPFLVAVTDIELIDGEGERVRVQRPIPASSVTVRPESDVLRFDPAYAVTDSAGLAYFRAFVPSDAFVDGTDPAPAGDPRGALAADVSFHASESPPWGPRRATIPYAWLVESSGTLLVRHAGSDAWVPALPGEMFARGDGLRFAAEAGLPTAVVVLADGQRLSLASQWGRPWGGWALYLGGVEQGVRIAWSLALVETSEHGMTPAYEVGVHRALGVGTEDAVRPFAISASSSTFGRQATLFSPLTAEAATRPSTPPPTIVPGAGVMVVAPRPGARGSRFAIDGVDRHWSISSSSEGWADIWNSGPACEARVGDAVVILARSAGMVLDPWRGRPVQLRDFAPRRNGMGVFVTEPGVQRTSRTPELQGRGEISWGASPDPSGLAWRVDGRFVPGTVEFNGSELRARVPRELGLTSGLHRLELFAASRYEDCADYVAQALPIDAAPDPPRPPRVLAGRESVLVTWTPSADPSVVGYRAWRSDASDGAFEPVQAERLNQPVLLDRLRPGQIAWYAVTAIDREGRESALSAAVRGTLDDGAELPPPAAPRVEAHAGDLSIDLSIEQHGLDGAWRVERASASDGPFMDRLDGAWLGTPRWRDGEVVEGQEYWYRVAAVGLDGELGASTTIGPVRVEDGPPAAPRQFMARALLGWAVLAQWDPAAEPDVERYTLLRARVGEELSPVQEVDATRSWAVDSPSEAGLYVYGLRAVDRGNNASEVTVATPSRVEVWSACSVHLRAADRGIITRSGGRARVYPEVAGPCPVPVLSGAEWLVRTNPPIDMIVGHLTGSVTVEFEAAPWQVDSTRETTISIGDQEHTIKQPGCLFQLDPRGADVSAGGGTVNLPVFTDDPCRWTARSTDPWIHVAKESGAGRSEVQFTVDPLEGGGGRMGTILVAGHAIPVRQTDSPLAIATVGGRGFLLPGVSADVVWMHDGPGARVDLAYSLDGGWRWKTFAKKARLGVSRLTVPKKAEPGDELIVRAVAYNSKGRKLATAKSPSVPVLPLVVDLPLGGDVFYYDRPFNIHFAAGALPEEVDRAVVALPIDYWPYWNVVADVPFTAPGELDLTVSVSWGDMSGTSVSSVAVFLLAKDRTVVSARGGQIVFYSP
jgi:hypothetical protein